MKHTAWVVLVVFCVDEGRFSEDNYARSKTKVLPV